MVREVPQGRYVGAGGDRKSEADRGGMLGRRGFSVFTIFAKHESDGNDRRLLGRCALAAICLIVAAFPDVIFFKASLSNANIVNITYDQQKKVRFLPERENRSIYDGLTDPGGAAFQSEPGIQFVRRSFRDGQSIYWNPYSATGAYGPETLVDIKTSPLSIATALLGGSDGVFHAVFLFFNLIAVFCLLALLTIEFRLSFVAALGGGVTYLLNGYYVANMGSNVSQTWLYFPVLTLALVSFARRPSALKMTGISCGAGLILATTFLPTTILTMATALLVGAAASVGHSISRERKLGSISRSAGGLIAGQLGGVALALLALAIVYLPIFEALKYMGTGDFYAKRQFFPTNLFNLISLFTPKHAFESYVAATPQLAVMRGNFAFHQGIIGALLATQIARPWPVFQRTILIPLCAMLLLLIARVYGVAGVSSVIDAIPVLGNLGEQYVWISIGLIFTIIVALGLHGLQNGGLRWIPLLVGAAVIGGAFAYTTLLWGKENIKEPLYLAVTLALLEAGVALIILRRTRVASIVVASSLVVLSWGELTFDLNHYKPVRYDRFLEPAPFIGVLQKQGGLHRIASYGQPGVPPEYGSAYGLYQIGSMNFQLFPRYEDLFNRLILPNPAQRWETFATLVLAPDTDFLNLPGLDFLGVRFLVLPATYGRLRHFVADSGWKTIYEDPKFAIVENPNPLPRALIVHQVSEGRQTPLDIDRSPRDVVTSDDPVFIAEARARGILGPNAEPPSQSEHAEITRYDHTRLEISASVSQKGVLVLNDAWHPNWRVWVDGEERHLGLVNQAFRGVLLDPGKHVVEMRYAPRTFLIGKIFSGIGLAVLVCLVLFRRWIDPRLAALMGRAADGASAQVRHAG
ncbi:YfhO family protein [Bradyrhizobium rifense]|uniref:YfhO family protein n=1 Tax=Bradyrhizobium rifense TaxID=515499 RepID=A0A5D3KBA2_9BRAD|nr:YfhO family protein [Bradyrhizobium rifense]TYL91759.1 YfhO family protein [Bradyrhizobium rifense]